MANPIPHNWEVPEVFRTRFGTRAGRQRVMSAEGHVLIILHEVPTARDPDRQARLHWRKPDGTWKSTGSGAATIGALRAQIEEFAVAIDALEARAEKASRAADWFGILHVTAPMLRTIAAQSATLQEARELAKGDRDLIAVRDQAQDNERAIELIHGHARAGLDYSIAKNAEDNAQSSKHVLESGHRLNMIAATFLPITALGALLGMNLEHGLEHWSSPYPFWLVAAAAFLLGLIIRGSLPNKPAQSVTP
jgi:Mg2+ and Co2+ transporter CorA